MNKVVKPLLFYLVIISVACLLVIVFVELKSSYNKKRLYRTDSELERQCMVYAQKVKEDIWQIECKKNNLPENCKLSSDKFIYLENLYDQRFNHCLVELIKDNEKYK